MLCFFVFLSLHSLIPFPGVSSHTREEGTLQINKFISLSFFLTFSFSLRKQIPRSSHCIEIVCRYASALNSTYYPATCPLRFVCHFISFYFFSLQIFQYSAGPFGEPRSPRSKLLSRQSSERRSVVKISHRDAEASVNSACSRSRRTLKLPSFAQLPRSKSSRLIFYTYLCRDGASYALLPVC